MLLADAGISFVWIGGLFIVGLVALLAVILRGLARALGYMVRLILGPPRSTIALRRPLDDLGQICPRSRCGHANRAAARYCARCGAALPTSQVLDRHG